MHHEITHWGAPFGGRQNELSHLLRLIQEGLAGNLAHITVRGDPGVGRRRLLREAFRQGPWAEWIDLSPGCTTMDLRRWSQDEMVDFLGAYPENTISSQSLSVLFPTSPPLRTNAGQPILSSEEVVSTPREAAAAVAAFATSLSAYAPAVIHVAVEPATDTWEGQVVEELARQLHNPGVVLVSTAGKNAEVADVPTQRSLNLEPHSAQGVMDVTRKWFGESLAQEAGPWLHRASGGNAFAMSEILRWLEEADCLRIDGSSGTVVPLIKVDKFPVPFNVHSIMQTRWDRLTPAARFLFHHIVHQAGRLTQEQLLAGYPGRDGYRGFHEALSLLRHRSFLYRSTFRYPLAPSSQLWINITEEPSKRKFKRIKTPARLRRAALGRA